MPSRPVAQVQTFNAQGFDAKAFPGAGHSLREDRPIALPHAALPALFVIVDVLVILASALAADVGYHSLAFDGSGDPQRSLGAGAVAALLFIALQHARKHYGSIRTIRLGAQLKAAACSWIIVFAALACVLFLLKMGDAFSRGVLLTFFFTALAGLSLWRLALKRLHRQLVVAGTVTGPRVAVLAENGRSDTNGLLQRLERYGYSLSRLFFLPPDGLAAGLAEQRTSEALQALVRHVREQRIDEILVVSSWHRFVSGDTQSIQAALRMVPVPVKLIADPELARAMSYQACDVGAARALLLKPSALSRAQRTGKRAFDIVVAALLLVALFPLLALATLAIKLDSRGPVFFRQGRGGYNGRRFRIVKFRTMHVQEDGETILQAGRGDPRVTRVGRFLRKTSIDELPQLLNVLAGDMSLVGPRPHAIAHDVAYAELIEPYPARHNVKPGITGWAQVNGCRGETRDVGLMQRRVDHDLDYIEQWSLLLDIRIILMTAREVLIPRNAH
jgi:Undecaprenyl-phosphate glucose phosphotransferase